MSEFAAPDGSSDAGGSSDDVPELFCTFALTGETLRHQAIYVCKTCTTLGRSMKGECCCEGCARTCHAGHKLEFVCFGAAYCDCGKAGESKCKLIGASRVEAEKILPSRKAAPSSSSASSPAADAQPFCRVHLIDYPRGRDEVLRQQCIELVRHSKETFWLARGDEPRCLLEQLAREILDYHCQGLPVTEAAGAEWWVQVKDASQGIDLHYDKDEKIAEVFQLGFFPSLSTVTYLTQGSSESPCQVPTVVFNTTANAPIGESPIREVAVSFPQLGKHISFQGDLLHGAPVQWLEGDQEDQEEEKPSKPSKMAASKGAGQQQRVTFLLNVWSDHRPAEVLPLPDEVLAAMTLVSPGASLPGCILSAHELPVEMSVSLADAKGETDRAGDFFTIPFISEASAWGKDEDEQGLVCVVWVPESTQAGRLPSEPSTVLIKYLHDDCAASLMYEDDDEEWEDEDEDEEEGGWKGAEGDKGVKR